MKVNDQKQWRHEMKSPLGILRLVSDGKSLNRIWFPTEGRGREKHDGLPTRPDLPVFVEAEKQLNEYFAGKRTEFELPMAASGTDFQQSVWNELCRIPVGVTTTYGALATKVGNAKASRAVGLANGANPLPIIVPCHRVVGANGTLTGFGGGLEAKRWLLVHEGVDLF